MPIGKGVFKVLTYYIGRFLDASKWNINENTLQCKKTAVRTGDIVSQTAPSNVREPRGVRRHRNTICNCKLLYVMVQTIKHDLNNNGTNMKSGTISHEDNWRRILADPMRNPSFSSVANPGLLCYNGRDIP